MDKNKIEIANWAEAESALCAINRLDLLAEEVRGQVNEQVAADKRGINEGLIYKAGRLAGALTRAYLLLRESCDGQPTDAVWPYEIPADVTDTLPPAAT